MADQQPDDDTAGGLVKRQPRPLICESFAGVNTATTRAGVPDQQCYWIDGWIPLGPRNLRTLWGLSSALYSAASLGASIVCFYFYNLGATPYAIIFLSNGGAVQVNTNTGAQTQVLAAGTIPAPSITDLGVSQYGSQYLLIIANQSNGYWIWDGTLLYTAGTLAPGVTLTDAGSGYTSVPLVSFTGGLGYGATAVATISDGSVSNITLTDPGQGYLSTDSVTVVITGGTTTGTGATFSVTMAEQTGASGASVTLTWALYSGAYYDITATTINSGGSNYSSAYVTGSWTSTAGFVNFGTPSITVEVTNGAVTGVTVAPNHGTLTLWNTSVGPVPQITISASNYYYVASVAITDGGTDYPSTATLTASNGGSPTTQATFSLTIVSGVIEEVVVTSGGVYGSNSAPTLAVTNNTAVNATATVSLMPFGVQGNAIETYQGRVWLVQNQTPTGALLTVSAPGSVSDFATSAGGLQTIDADPFLRVGYTQLLQTNGFLFLIGDSSMNYVSGVTTTTPSGGSPTTSFTNNNADPEVGTPYPAAITTLGQDILIANSTGVHISSGGEFVKRSEAMDGVYNTVADFNGLQLSAAKATIFGKRVWMVLVPIIDPVSGNTDNKLLMFRDDGKIWWAGHQDVKLTFIAAQEINATYTAWGTDGTSIYQLFAQPSIGFKKTIQTRLWDLPGSYDYLKTAVSLFAIAQFVGTEDLSYSISIDNEFGVPSTQVTGNPVTGTPTAFTWQDAAGATFTWEDGSSQTFTWGVAGSNIFSILAPTAIGQTGVLIGMTTTTNCNDMVLVSEMLQPEIVGYRA